MGSSCTEQGGIYNPIILAPQEELTLKSTHTISAGSNFSGNDTWRLEIDA